MSLTYGLDFNKRRKMYNELMNFLQPSKKRKAMVMKNVELYTNNAQVIANMNKKINSVKEMQKCMKMKEYTDPKNIVSYYKNEPIYKHQLHKLFKDEVI